jgi:hypothetical protein
LAHDRRRRPDDRGEPHQDPAHPVGYRNDWETASSVPGDAA